MRRGIEQRFASGTIRGCADCAGAGVGRHGSGGVPCGGGETFAGDGVGEAAAGAEGGGGVEGGGDAAGGRERADFRGGFGLSLEILLGWRSAGLSFINSRRFADFRCRARVEVLPRSLRSMADVRAARTEEEIGHSGRDDNAKKRETKEHRQECLCHKSGTIYRAPTSWAGTGPLAAGFAEEFGGG